MEGWSRDVNDLYGPVGKFVSLDFVSGRGGGVENPEGFT